MAQVSLSNAATAEAFGRPVTGANFGSPPPNGVVRPSAMASPPQHTTVPSQVIAQVCACPAASRNARSEGTSTGVDDGGLPFGPSRNASGFPQHQTLLSARSAHECPVPLTTSMASSIFGTRTGTYESVPVPSPSSPKRLEPQHHTLPSFLTAQLNLPPLETASNDCSKTVNGSATTLALGGFPTWPRLFKPKHWT